MVMGLPVEGERWPRFRVLVSAGSASGPVDANGVPFDLEGEVVEPEYRFERPACAVETTGSADSPWLSPGQVLFTLLDEEWELVRGFDQVEMWLGGVGSGAAVYRFDRVVQQPTLETVGVWQVLCKTEDAT